MNEIVITIKKPLSGNYCSIRDVYVEQAIREGKKLRIVLPNGEAMIDPREWKRTGKRIEKVFKIPDHPMILYANMVPINRKEKDDEQLKLI